MKNSKGFTLVEVIVSLAILGILAVVFLGAISAHFTYMKSTVNITHNDFEAQEKMEVEMDKAKLRVIKPGASLQTTKIFNSDLGGIEVKYEALMISHNNKDYFTLVSNVRPDPLEIISLESIGIKLMQGSTQVQDDYYAYPTNEFNIVGNFENDNIYKWDHLLNQVEWYVSSDKYNIPLPKVESTDLNDADHHYYPIFPRDYEIFSNETVYKFGSSQSNFTDIKDIAGRHIVYTVTPAAKSGKLGEQKVSKPIYISGLPVTSNLVTHLDASYIDILSGTTEIQKSGTNNFLKVWYDISSIKGRSAPNESALSPNDNNFRPNVNRSDVSDRFIGQYIKFETNKYIQLNQGSSGNQVIVYAVLKNRSNVTSKYLVNGSRELVIGAPSEENINQWTIIRSNLTLDGTNLKIGDSETDIAELIIFSNSMSEEDNTKVLDYLSVKYFTNNITDNN